MATGRPRGSKKITPALTKQICDLIELGTPPHYAAQAKGIPEQTYWEWMQQAKAGNKAYEEFSLAIARARANTIPRMLARAHSGVKGSSAAMWVLEKQYRKEFGATVKEDESQKVEIVIKGGLPEFPK